MSTARKKERFVNYISELNVSWLTVSVFAVFLAYANGFGLTSLQGAIGAVERQRPPFQRWLIDSTLMLPLFFAAVVAALILARRWVGQNKRGWVKVLVSALLVVGIGTALATVEATASSAYDYTLQGKHIELMNTLHHDTPFVGATTTPKCDFVCTAKRETLVIHFTAVCYFALVMLLANLVLVFWLLAVRGGRLWVPKKSTHSRVVESMGQPALA